MASKIYYFSGEFRWAKLLQPDTEYECYSTDVILDPSSLDLFNKSELRLKVRTEEDGRSSVKFRRSMTKKNYTTDTEEPQGPPEIVFAEGAKPEKWNGLVGNGSEGAVKVEVYDSKKGKGHRLLKVRVDTLVPYGSDDEVPEGVLPF